jgi:hypothetical protein
LTFSNWGLLLLVGDCPWEVDSLYRVMRWARRRGIDQPESRNEEEIVWTNRESPCKEIREGALNEL